MNFKEEGHLLIGISGAAFAMFSAANISYLRQNVCKYIKFVTTESAKQFINEQALHVLLGDNPKAISDGNENVEHISLPNWADIFIVLPSSANTISKAANGIADNTLLQSILAAKCPVIFYPSMNLNMWRSVILQKNITTLERAGYYFSYSIDPNLTLYNQRYDEKIVHPSIPMIQTDILKALKIERDETIEYKTSV